jgi:hypothetical protein
LYSKASKEVVIVEFCSEEAPQEDAQEEAQEAPQAYPLAEKEQVAVSPFRRSPDRLRRRGL